jgi:hypothetical protein
MIFGANEPLVEYIERDMAYATKALELAAAFMLCVQSKTPSVILTGPERRERKARLG